MENDDLGRVGELFFDSLCTRARLTCNSSNRDKVGWDFVVDFPHEHSQHTFDHRPGPLSCVVQVKSVNNGARRVMVRLDMAERLAKEIKPSFFVCPVYEGEEPIRLYVIHVRGKPLEAILKRLRQAQASRNPQRLSKKSVSFALVERDRLSGLEPSVLRQTFSDACPNGMDVYAVEKAKERKSLGYDDKAYAGKFSVELSNPDELMDFFFGRRRELPVEMGDILETRFGITLPHVPGGPGLLSIDPAPRGRALVRIHADGAGDPFVATGEFFTLPFDIEGHYRVELRCPGFLVTATRRPEATLDVRLDLDWDGAEWTVSDWLEHARLRLLMVVDNSFIEGEVEHDGRMRRIFHVPLSDGEPFAVNTVNHHRIMSAVAKRVLTLSRAAGFDQALRLSADEFEIAMGGAMPVLALERGMTIQLGVEGMGADGTFPDRALVGGCFRLKDDSYVWYGVMEVHTEQAQPTKLTMSGFSGMRVCRKEEQQSFADFLAARRLEHSLAEAFFLEWSGGRAIARRVVPNSEAVAECPHPQ
ncbi:MAG: hypothetical protein AAGC76_01995 [Luteibacter sp.]|uniref:hypothetical protein n=1 Tax=Luteibacter sp. TaxID=1886636 RepID=UPI0028088FB7|nr:hypothetical protein [Luteibacter sp.]MDQ7994605.1 hypothetical protein [Luteibacter sp.]